MNFYYITGASRGIGKSFAELLLNDENNFVTGISRTNSIKHPNYRHVELDLSDTEKTAQFRFPNHDNASRIVLVNNAGYIGEIKRIGSHNNETLVKAYKVNLIAPSVLTNSFIKAYRKSTAQKIIFNVTSGAGRHPVDAWGAYCASKAGLDMFSRVVGAEQDITGSGFKIISVGPGVVDTEMQAMLRNSDENEFTRKAEFVGYKKDGKLSSTESVAEKFKEIIKNIREINEIVFSTREYEAKKNK